MRYICDNNLSLQYGKYKKSKSDPEMSRVLTLKSQISHVFCCISALCGEAVSWSPLGKYSNQISLEENNIQRMLPICLRKSLLGQIETQLISLEAFGRFETFDFLRHLLMSQSKVFSRWYFLIGRTFNKPSFCGFLWLAACKRCSIPH